MLLTRDEFRTQVFERDSHACVFCGSTESLNAHHIIERRLWPDGGYYLDNGATLCGKDETSCHYKAETTEISVETLRELCGCKKIIPEDMYDDLVYDKWGNVFLENGKRSKGPLFYDESVQKVLSKFLSVFVNYVKYPRTYHLSFSEGVTSDDKMHKDFSCFERKFVVLTKKMDGENFSGYRDYCHARSIDSKSHYTRNYAQTYWFERSYLLPEGWRICAENLYAKHSIGYENLESYLLGFSVWDDLNMCLSWEDTKIWFELLDMKIVEEVYHGIFDEKIIREICKNNDNSVNEGYVLRLAESFHYNNFEKSVAKYVRANHVNPESAHWFYGKTNHKINRLKERGLRNVETSSSNAVFRNLSARGS